MSMVLIADSGSTKTAWCLVGDSQVVKQFETAGINPFFQTEDEIVAQLKEGLLPEVGANCVENIYFMAQVVLILRKISRLRGC